MSNFDTVKKFLESFPLENIHFKQHFYERTLERPISEELVKKYIKQTDRLLQVEEQPARNPAEEKYKIWIKLSYKYSLVLVITISRKALYILMGWNTDRKWQKSIQK